MCPEGYMFDKEIKGHEHCIGSWIVRVYFFFYDEKESVRLWHIGLIYWIYERLMIFVLVVIVEQISANYRRIVHFWK